jgi:hypothetical protein
VEHTLIEENAIYVGAGIDVQMVLMSDWSGWASDTRFVRNRFYVEGTARYGHGTSKNPDGTYVLADGWGPAVGTAFEGNLYFGNHVPMPADEQRQPAPRVPPVRTKWNSPEFDPAHPESFDAFLTEHRTWLRELMESEFGPLP